MSRSMERTGIQALIDSTLNVLLAPPSGHKYEVIEAAINTDGTDDAVLVDFLHIGAGYLLMAWTTHEVSGASVLRLEHEGCVVYEGEEWGLIPIGGGSPTFGCVTYVDVDFTN